MISSEQTERSEAILLRAFCLLCVIGWGLIECVHAEISGMSGTRLEEIQAKVSRHTAQHNKIKKSLSTTTDRLAKHKKQIAELRIKEARSRKEVESASAEKIEIEAEIRILNERIDRYHNFSLGRVRALYMFKTQSLLDSVMQTNGNAGFVRNTYYLSRIREHDLLIIDEFTDKLRKREALQKKLGLLFNKQTAYKKQLSVYRKDLEVAYQNAVVMQARLKREVKEEESLLIKLRAESLRLETVLLSLTELQNTDQVVTVRRKRAREGGDYQGQGLKSQKDSLLRPVSGRIEQAFGKSSGKGFSEMVFSKGVRFSTGTGAPVKAIADAEVIHKGKMPAYGNMLILNHGKREYSVYGLLSEVHVEKSDTIEKGDLIGLAAAGNGGLYFEVRINGVPADPELFFDSLR